MMHLRSFVLIAVCGALAWAGYGVSVLRAGNEAPISEVLAAAGGESGFMQGGESAGGKDNYRISALSVFSNVALHVKDNYVDPERIDPKEMLISALREIERQVAEVLVEDLGNGRLSVRVMEHEKIVYIDDVESLWEINLKLRDVFRFFEKHLPPQQDVRAIEYAAVNGALATLDPHSVLLKPEAFAEMKTSTKGEFGGLGIVISVRDAKLTIISPLEGTPAARAGLKAGDVITRIGDVSTVSMPIEEAVRMLRGPEGSKVTIWVIRKGWADDKRFDIVRERIKIESVESKLLSSNVGYMKIKNFQQSTGKDLEDQLEVLRQKADGNLKGLVMDLRNNPGGLLEQAIRVSDKFLTSGDIVTTVGYGNKLREPKRARWSGTESELPIAVLVNKGSASASEIVAGALKNLDRAVVIGERTFGKGSVQVLYDFTDNSALKLTIAQYLTPGGISIQNEGVTPDFELKPARLEENSVHLFYEPEGHREKNLDKHLERTGTKAVPENRPKYSLKYLVENPQEATEDEEPAEEEYNEFEEDYQIKFAREYLMAIGHRSRAKMLERSNSFIEGRQTAEEKRIVERMKVLNVDWSTGAAQTPGAKIDVELALTKGATKGRIEAGSEVELVASVTNAGTVPVHRLRGLIESEHPAFKGKEFLFGRLDPGQNRKWSVSTKIPKEAASRSDVLTLTLASSTGDIANEAVLPVVTKYVAHPQFAYTFAYDDEKRGDGDGVLEVGEGVEFMLFVTNTGPGDADDVSLRLKNGAGEQLFLERGRVTIGAIKAGETRAGRLKFRVQSTPQTAQQPLPLELTIYDSGTGEWLEDQFSVVAKPARSGKLVKKAGAATVARDTVILSGPGGDVLATVKKGAKLNVDAKNGDFNRVLLMDEAFGWVKANELKLKGAAQKTPAVVAYRPKRRPPTIDLTSDLGGRVVDSESVELSGTISGRSLRDMYVTVNEKKVYFRSGPEAPQAEVTDEAVEPNDQAVALPFKLDLRLDEGLNKVLIVARLDERVISYRSLFVSRRSAPRAAVATTDTPPKPAKQSP
jgi:carboxyl-terminal processing protease